MKAPLHRIVVVASRAGDRELYRSVLTSMENLVVEDFASLKGFREQCRGKRYVGVVADVRTMVGATRRDKVVYNVLLNALPVLRVRPGRRPDELTGFVGGGRLTGLKGRALFAAFVDDICRHCPPRGLRFTPRKQVFLCGLLWMAHAGEASPGIRITLKNIGEGGCLVVCNEPAARGDRVVLRLPGIWGEAPVVCQVCWVRPWSVEARYLPGFGASFVDPTEDMVARLIDLS